MVGGRTGDGLRFAPGEPEPPALQAFFGVRSCDLHAIAVQDRVLLGGEHPDPHYARRRDGLLIVAVQCSDPADTCFCTSMGTGPRAVGGFDLALTELLDGQGHRFVVEVATERVPSCSPACRPRRRRHRPRRARAGSPWSGGVDHPVRRHRRHPRPAGLQPRAPPLGRRRRTLPGLHQLHPGVPDVLLQHGGGHSDLAGENAERSRRWDSCFTLDHSYLHGGSVRPTHRARYRQWLTHKLGTWIDQFDSSGCVGCGRCITWCPVGIDLTEEVAAIRADPVTEPGAVVPYPAGRFDDGRQGPSATCSPSTRSSPTSPTPTSTSSPGAGGTCTSPPTR